jgi:hypothetical protein
MYPDLVQLDWVAIAHNANVAQGRVHRCVDRLSSPAELSGVFRGFDDVSVDLSTLNYAFGSRWRIHDSLKASDECSSESQDEFKV